MVAIDAYSTKIQKCFNTFFRKLFIDILMVNIIIHK